MVLKFIGEKALISEKGVGFDRRKQDKYIYLVFLAELIKALDHEYTSKEPYQYDIAPQSFDSQHFLSLLEVKIPSVRDEIGYYQKRADEEIDEEIRRVRAHLLMNEEEKESFIRNLELMRGYQIGRSLNKAAYYAGITYLAQIIHDRKIAYVSAPLLPIYFHIFHSIQGALAKRHPPMQSTIDIYERQGVLQTRLTLD